MKIRCGVELIGTSGLGKAETEDHLSKVMLEHGWMGVLLALRNMSGQIRPFLEVTDDG